MDEANTFALASVLFTDYEHEQKKVLIDEDLDLIRNVPGVVNAIATRHMNAKRIQSTIRPRLSCRLRRSAAPSGAEAR